jgi:uncharacterized SAM-binding protein YcdF (DUF218 family)
VIGRIVIRAASWPLVRRDRRRSADAIVVLGGPPTPSGELSQICAERVDAGIALWREGLAPVIYITGGPCGRNGEIEADIMGAYAREQGVPEGALVLERRALTTADNARYVAEMLPEGAEVWLVTTPFHLRRSMRLFRRVGLRPLAWHIDESLQYREPRRAVRWIAREYGAWVWMLARRRG